MKMRYVFILLLLPVLVSTYSCKPQTLSLTKKEWAGDIDYFAQRLRKKHKNIFHTTTEEQFSNSINALKTDLDSLTIPEIIVRLQQIAASVGDGHTFLEMPASFHRYPLKTFWFGNDLYVTGATQEYKEALGKRLKRVNGIDISEVRIRIQTLLASGENEWFRLATGPYYQSIPEILIGLGIITTIDNNTFSFLDSTNNETKLNIHPIMSSDQPLWISASKEEPLYRKNQDKPFWFSSLKELDAVYVNFKSYKDLAKNVDNLFDFINSTKAFRLIVDMRDNGGGDFTKVREQFIPKIIKHSEINKKGNLFVITGRRTFSAAMTNSIDFKNQTNATIIGEPPGEKPNSYQENREMELPNSGLKVSYSIKYYKFLPEDLAAFTPDILVEPDWQSYLKGIDPVLERIKFIIKK